jgi:hypothetical protein
LTRRSWGAAGGRRSTTATTRVNGSQASWLRTSTVICELGDGEGEEEDGDSSWVYYYKRNELGKLAPSCCCRLHWQQLHGVFFHAS